MYFFIHPFIHLKGKITEKEGETYKENSSLQDPARPPGAACGWQRHKH